MKNILFFIILLSVYSFGQENRTVRQNDMRDTLNANSRKFVNETKLTDSLNTVRASLALKATLVITDSLAEDIAGIADSNFVLTSETSNWDKNSANDWTDSTFVYQAIALKASLVITDSLAEDIALKLDSDFTGLDEYTPSSTDIVPFYSNELAATKRTTLAELPISTSVSGELNNKVNLDAIQDNDLPSYSDFYQAYQDTIAWLIAYINSKTITVEPPLVPTTPTNLVATAGSGATADIVLTWNTSGYYDSIRVYASTDDGETWIIDPIAYIDSPAVTYTHVSRPAGITHWYYVKAVKGDSVSPASNIAKATIANEIITEGWYVSTESDGDGSGTSWANKANWQTFNISVVQPGETVYFDGGTDSLVYSTTKAGNAVLYWDRSGTTNNKIRLTRGVEAGHNGVPVFKPSGVDVVPILIGYGTHDLEISYFKTRQAALPTNGSLQSLSIRGCYNVDILYNEIIYPYGNGIYMDYANNIKIWHNEFNTTTIDYSHTGDAIKGVGDGNPDNTRSTGNFDIGYNTFIQQHVYDTDESGAHADMIQLSYYQKGNHSTAITKIHHNYFLQNSSVTPAFCATITTNHNSGKWWVYNNVFNMQGGDGNVWYEALGGTDYSKAPTIRIMNNTFILPEYSELGLMGLDSLYLVNNLFYRTSSAPSNHKIMMWSTVPSDQYFYIRNNKYQIVGTTGVGGVGSSNYSVSTSYSKDQWISMFSDNSIWGTITFEGGSYTSTTVTDYVLDEEDDGIDAGIDLSAYFTDDYEGKVRTGDWDVGAFEFGEGGGGGEGYPELALNTAFTDINNTQSSNGVLKLYSSNYNSIASLPSSCIMDSATYYSNVRFRVLLSEAVSTGATYTVKFDYYLPDLDSTTNIECFGIDASGNDEVISGWGANATTGAWTSVTVDYTANYAWDRVGFRFRNVNAIYPIETDPADKIYIDNLSVKRK